MKLGWLYAEVIAPIVLALTPWLACVFYASDLHHAFARTLGGGDLMPLGTLVLASLLRRMLDAPAAARESDPGLWEFYFWTSLLVMVVCVGALTLAKFFFIRYEFPIGDGPVDPRVTGAAWASFAFVLVAAFLSYRVRNWLDGFH